MHDQFIDMTIFQISRDELTKFFQKIIFSKLCTGIAASFWFLGQGGIQYLHNTSVLSL